MAISLFTWVPLRSAEVPAPLLTVLPFVMSVNGIFRIFFLIKLILFISIMFLEARLFIES